ncbi:sugar ABC transporter ATP-binding protein [Rhizobium leguminosarum]|uniref:sugar ABC transporter ATP-binding protein n=1 Tax=Rhizobium TaxID=379 RepID=UPI00102F483E|nr:sugar ABC transporter ATP-binding protein [Rhizobium leguminosarum]TBF70767.1 sugar ABC transporter ATP-binding protein [Rhizobium leguminosarum]TBG93363.1 sugar ABC transporter ATP-binding protein [Rhizobium leguminosarum]TBG96017.1 sugar ABC transporter ATP-binding protein [Rhizobium leguminosarum]TBH28744.1 sugar ABC transporter ATP-binding protein [Rhizobium leguminosarum]TBH59544.1 sugar ABC transporter ATP-binding protein [Rhizobium leguminosarum]
MATPNEPATSAIVAMENISKSFGANKVLKDVSFAVRPGEVHALLGENGAGKSTLMKALIGVHHVDEGRILLEGNDVTALALRDRMDRGIAMIFQELSVLPNRSVAENLFLLREPRAPGFRVDRKRMIREADALIAQYGFALKSTDIVGDLGFAQRQMVEILKAISRRARLIVMDEPTSSLTVQEEETLFATIAQLKATGIGIVYISHRMADVLRLSDRISIVKDGRMVGPFHPEETSIDHIAALMSRPRDAGTADPPHEESVSANRVRLAGSRPPALSVRGLSTSRKLDAISFDIAPGEIVGLGGLVGSGRSALAKALFGMLPDVRGQIAISGTPFVPGSVSRAIAAGVALVPEDRRLEGLIGGRSLAENFALPSLSRFAKLGGLAPVATGRINSLFDRYRNDLSLLCRGPHQLAQQLSGGNQQKVVFAKWLAMGPKLLILDEPTSGVDINAKRDMRALVRRTAATGVGVLLISSELEELIDLSDRILVMAAGRVTRSIERADNESQLRSLLQTEAARHTFPPKKEERA